MRRRREQVVLGRGARPREESEPELTLEEELEQAERDAEEKSTELRQAFVTSAAAGLRRDQLRAAVERKHRLEYEVEVALEGAARAEKDAKAAGKLGAQSRREAETIAIEAHVQRCEELLDALEPARTRLGELQAERDDAIFTARPEETIARLGNEIAEAADQVQALEEDVERAVQERSETEQRRAKLFGEADRQAAEVARLHEEARALRLRAEALPEEARRQAVAERERIAQLVRLPSPKPDPRLLMLGGEKESPMIDANGFLHLGDNWIATPNGVARFE